MLVSLKQIRHYKQFLTDQVFNVDCKPYQLQDATNLIFDRQFSHTTSVIEALLHIAASLDTYALVNFLEQNTLLKAYLVYKTTELPINYLVLLKLDEAIDTVFTLHDLKQIYENLLKATDKIYKDLSSKRLCKAFVIAYTTKQIASVLQQETIELHDMYFTIASALEDIANYNSCLKSIDSVFWLHVPFTQIYATNLNWSKLFDKVTFALIAGYLLDSYYQGHAFDFYLKQDRSLAFVNPLLALLFKVFGNTIVQRRLRSYLLQILAAINCNDIQVQNLVTQTVYNGLSKELWSLQRIPVVVAENLLRRNPFKVPVNSTYTLVEKQNTDIWGRVLSHYLLYF